MTLANPTPAPAALGLSERVVVDRAFDAGRAAWGDLGIDREDFRARVARLAFRAGGCPPSGAPSGDAAESIHAAALSDLVLASACEAGAPGAWAVLDGRFRPRLEGFAARRGLGSFEAESMVQDLLGDLAGPPPRPPSRTLLGTYDGSGSLFGWLCVVLLRRIAGSARRRRPTSLDAQDRDAVAGALPAVPRAPALDPAAFAAGVEAHARFERALDEAWDVLTPQERLAILFKHRDGLTQRQIGSVLGVGEARVSRVVGSAVAKLAGGVGPAMPGGIPSGDEGLSAALALTLARRIAMEGSVDAGHATAPRSGAQGLRPGVSPDRRG